MAPEPCDTIFIGDLPFELTADEFSAVFGAFGTIKWSKMWKGGKGGKQAALLQFETLEEATWVVENVNGNIPEGLSTPVMVKYKEESKGKQKGGAEAAGGKGKDRGGPYSKNGAGPYQPPNFDKGGKGGYGGKEGGYGGKGGKGEFGARELVNGLYSSGAMPGGTKYENDENTVYVTGLPTDSTNETLYMIFAPFGAIAPRGARAMMNPDGSCKGFGFVNFLASTGSQTAISTLNGAQMPNGTTLGVQKKSLGGKAGGKGGCAIKGA